MAVPLLSSANESAIVIVDPRTDLAAVERHLGSAIIAAAILTLCSHPCRGDEDVLAGIDVAAARYGASITATAGPGKALEPTVAIEDLAAAGSHVHLR